MMVFSGGGPACAWGSRDAIGVSGWDARRARDPSRAERSDPRIGSDATFDGNAEIDASNATGASAYLAGVAHDQHAVAAGHGFDDAVHPSSSGRDHGGRRVLESVPSRWRMRSFFTAGGFRTQKPKLIAKIVDCCARVPNF